MIHGMFRLMAAVLATLAGGGEQEKPAGAAPSAFVEPQDPDRPALPAMDLRSLKESNIFSPKKVVRTKTGTGPRPPEPPREKPKPKPPVVTGIIYDPSTKSYQVVIEDRNTDKLRLLSEPKFLRAGDQVLVYTIESVETEKVVVSVGGATKELKVGEAMPDGGFKAPEGVDTSSEEDPEAAPAEAKADPSADPKGESSKESRTGRKNDSKSTDASKSSSGSSSTMDEETRKKILEERMKRLGKKRPE